jgi:MFS family permease
MASEQRDGAETARDEWRARWPLVLTSTIGLSLPGISIVTIGAFIAPLEAAFGWSRSEVTSGLTIYSLVAVFGQPIVGRMVDLWGPRRIALLGTLLSGITFSLFATTDGSLSGWLLRWLLYALAVQLVQMPVWSSAVASEFEAGRGLALAIASTGASWCSMIAPICATLLIGRHGWPAAYVVIGVVQAGVSLILAWFFFYSRHERLHASKGPTANVERQGVSAREGLRSPVFYKMLLGTLISYTLGTAVSIHLIPILTSTGLNAEQAAVVAGTNGLFSLVGAIGSGLLTSRMEGNVLYAVLCVMPIVAFLMLMMPSNSVALRIFAVAFLGLSSGPRLNILMYMTTRHFGLRAYGLLFGFMFIPVKLSNGAGGGLASYLYDVSHSYNLLLTICSVGSIVACLVMLWVGRYPSASRTSAMPEPAPAR